MMNQLSEIAPAGAVAASLVWAVISYEFSGPELADRISYADYIATCEQRVAQGASRAVEGSINQTNQVSDMERRAQAARNYVRALENAYGAENIRGFDMFMGGAISQAVNQAEALERQARDARNQARRMIQNRRDAVIDTAKDQCSCQVAAALGESRVDWAVFAGTFGIIEKEGVTNFSSRMRANSRMCAERVLS
ncbi:hypothetical protein [Tateyamaria sp. ANG-S1]|uniref:hypothetical protein n=1 Tax=Tateyamaria sp. ANG-S1 TaxID=1577905 RepID=UPI00057DBA05|nr:hypothetical protein [Tateyamaria sp. ANG-S1]KIC50977.1 hypothetical protein RA29_03575 [Tateyamaria sp. ANG-S1]